MLRWACSRVSARYLHRIVHVRLMSISLSPSPDDNAPTFTFPEEPLGLPATAGYGFFQGTPYDELGLDGRFQLQAKLGFGTNCSVWLAKDRQLNSHVAVKILSGYASQLNAEMKLRELTVHERLSALPAEETKHCSQLIAHFIHKGIEKDGDHLCLVLKLEQATLAAVHNEHRGEFYPVPIVKRILLHILRGLAALHKCRVAHTDLKPDNIMVGLLPSSTTQGIDAWVLEHEPHVYGPCQSLDKVVTQAFVSTQMPLPSMAELETCDFKVADFSNAQELDDWTSNEVTSLTLRAPEIILGGPWNEKIDIWSLGCLVFTLLTHQPLFPHGVKPIHHEHLRPGFEPTEKGIETDYVLWLITLFTDQRYPSGVLDLYANSRDYFEENGDWKRFKKGYGRRPLDMCIHDTGRTVPDEDIAGACSLMKRCLQLNPTDRPSAIELLNDPWLQYKQVSI
ncbi:kinase-like domain-containing protein [Mycena maculata]|uniref:Kinase-like domain-containing protein n=1 Tax=Mycena maculata TaxID=230809 RepID=A0AAD7HHS0_9AGAR|nr:kinase-like domain-containing protein [Mycena maculata]